MNPIGRIRRITTVLASLAAGLVAFAALAFASVPHPGGTRPCSPGLCSLPEPG